MSDTIIRDAGDKAKGFRLQKLRAVKLMLDVLTTPQMAVYCAIEAEGDVNFRVYGAAPKHYFEEDKNYNPTVGFTISSAEIINTIVIFLDIYISRSCSALIKFGFYSTGKLGKEKKTKRVKALNVALPNSGCLKALAAGKLDADVISFARAAICAEYRTQYVERTGGHLATIVAWSDDEWRGFFTQIKWSFEQGDHEAVEAELYDNVRSHRLFPAMLTGKEFLIVAALIDIFDRRQVDPDPQGRSVAGADVENVYLRASQGLLAIDDPAADAWDTLKAPEDTRNLSEKVLEIAPEIARTHLNSIERKASLGAAARKKMDVVPSFRAMHWWIVDVCDDVIRKRIAPPSTLENLSGVRFDQLIDDLHSHVKTELNERSKTFTVLDDDSTIRAAIFHLIDSCYLSFREDAAIPATGEAGS